MEGDGESGFVYERLDFVLEGEHEDLEEFGFFSMTPRPSAESPGLRTLTASERVIGVIPEKPSRPNSKSSELEIIVLEDNEAADERDVRVSEAAEGETFTCGVEFISVVDLEENGNVGLSLQLDQTEQDKRQKRQKQQAEGSVEGSKKTPEDIALESKGDLSAAQGSSLTAGGPDPPSSSAPPWAGPTLGIPGDVGSIRSPFLRLHQEIMDFCCFVAPTAAERQERREAVERVTAVVHGIWPDCQVEVFGSYATGLYLPSSDIDAVVLGSGCSSVQRGLKALARALVGKSMAHSIQVIAHARVPIVKFVESASGVSFDISFDMPGGPQAAKFIQRAMERMPPLRPLCLVLKMFLQQRGLNEVFKGGLGSYALIVTIIFYLQTHPSRRGKGGRLETNLGVLLLGYLRLFGALLNTAEVGISLRRGGCFFHKKAWGMAVPAKPYLLSIEDPLAMNNDLSRGSSRIETIRAAFKRAHSVLISATASPPPPMSSAAGGSGTTDSLWGLARIIRADKILALRRLGPPASPPWGQPGSPMAAEFQSEFAPSFLGIGASNGCRWGSGAAGTPRCQPPWQGDRWEDRGQQEDADFPRSKGAGWGDERGEERAQRAGKSRKSEGGGRRFLEKWLSGQRREKNRQHSGEKRRRKGAMHGKRKERDAEEPDVPDAARRRGSRGWSHS